MSMKQGSLQKTLKELTTVKSGSTKTSITKRYPSREKRLQPKQGNKKCYLYQKHYIGRTVEKLEVKS